MALWSSLFSPATPTPRRVRPSLTFFFFLVGAFVLTLVPHVIELPVWVSVSVVIALIIRSFMEVYRLPLPSTTFCSLVAVCLLCGVLLQFKTMFGRDAGMAFIAGLLAIKFFEIRGPRDIALIIFSGYFVVMSALLFSQVIELFIYCLIMMWVLTALLRRLQIGDLPEDRLIYMLRWAGVIFLQALPLTIVLFFFFPRYSGKLQFNMGEASLGFTNTVNPGDIASLSKSDAEAMYVRFLNGDVPLPESMYWRGLVLWHYQNGAWVTGMLGEAPIPQSELPSSTPGSNIVEQEITLYPHFQKWLFALDYPISAAVDTAEPQPWSTMLMGDVLQLIPTDRSKVDHKERYTAVSASGLNDQVLSKAEEEAGTQLPSPNDYRHDPSDRIDKDVQALADRLRGENPNDKAYAYAVLRYFRRERFVYTASPGIRDKGPKWLHEFLFETKAGFCEHYAAAFAVIMRRGHVPARLVVGYQGATYNPYKNIYSVAQSNAHAWDEIWLDAKNQPTSGKRIGRWVRIDPTATLPPGEGAEEGSNNPGQQPSADELASQVAQHQPSFSETYLPPWMSHGLDELQLRREQMEADWDDLVFSYDPTSQDHLAEALGFGRNPTFLLTLACLVSMAICAVIFRQWIKRKPPLSPVENLYATFCQDMAQRGIPRATWEGPLAYTGRVAEAFPEKEEAIRHVGSIVAHSRYGPPPIESISPAELKSLLLLITASQAASSSRDNS